MLIVLVLSATWNLVYAVGIGLVIASLMFMKNIGDLTAKRSKISTLDKDDVPWDDEKAFPSALKEEVFIKHINGPLFFGSTSDFQNLIKQVPATATTLVVRMDQMEYMDQSGLYAIEDSLIELVDSGVTVLLVNIPEQPYYMMERVDIIPDLISKEHIFDSIYKCIAWVKDNVKDEV